MKEGWLRRRILWYLRRGYVKRMISRRKGACLRCGGCCIGCPAYNGKKKSCRIYRFRPSICKNFPLTPEDICKIESCGFSFCDE